MGKALKTGTRIKIPRVRFLQILTADKSVEKAFLSAVFLKNY